MIFKKNFHFRENKKTAKKRESDEKRDD